MWYPDPAHVAYYDRNAQPATIDCQSQIDGPVYSSTLLSPGFGASQGLQPSLFKPREPTAYQRTLLEEEHRFYTTFPDAAKALHDQRLANLNDFQLQGDTGLFASDLYASKPEHPSPIHIPLNPAHQCLASSPYYTLSAHAGLTSNDLWPSSTSSLSPDCACTQLGQTKHPKLEHQSGLSGPGQTGDVALVTKTPVSQVQKGSMPNDSSFESSSQTYPSPLPIHPCLTVEPIMDALSRDNSPTTATLSSTINVRPTLTASSKPSRRSSNKQRKLQKPSCKATTTGRPQKKTDWAEHKEKKVACFFCRYRKIACGQVDPSSPDKTCSQCHRRRLECVYPTASRRGMRKRKDENRCDGLEPDSEM